MCQLEQSSQWWATPGSGHIFRHLWHMDKPLQTLPSISDPPQAFPTFTDPMWAFAIICQPEIAIVNSHNHLPHVCEPPAMLHDKFRPFPTLLSLKFWLSSYSDILPVSLQLSGWLLAQLCSLQSHDHLPSIAFVSQRTSEPFYPIYLVITVPLIRFSEFSVYFCSFLYSSLATYLKKKKGVLPTFHIASVSLRLRSDSNCVFVLVFENSA